MRKEEILEILNDWNFWKKELYTGMRRSEYIEKATSFLKTNMILSIIGIRRSGKSFIMRQIAKTLIESGVDPREMLIVTSPTSKECGLPCDTEVTVPRGDKFIYQMI